MTSKGGKILLGGGLVALLLIIGAVFWMSRLGTYTPVAAYRDVRAAMQVSTEWQAGRTERPVKRFLEIRYGPLTDAGNRQTALLDFFNVDHIEGLYLVLQRLPQGRRQLRIAEMADWIAEYRQTMSADEKHALQAYFGSAEGKAQIRQATRGYLTKDSVFRAETAPVIEELMATLVAIQQP
jgi:hypothetical protein